MQNKTADLGVVYLPENPGTPVGSFDFVVTAEAVNVEVGTPVAAETSEGVYVGTVTDMRTVGTDSGPVYADLASSGPQKIGSLNEVVVATVQVASSPRMRPVRSGNVRGASREEILAATGSDRIDWAVPAGVVDLVDGSYAAINLDGHSTFGPEAAHCLIGGLSGMAAKSSYGGVLLRGAVHTVQTVNETLGAIIFNVKGEDLLHLDKPPAAGYELTDSDHAMYKALNIPAEPFNNVTVYGPGLPGGGAATNSARTDAIPLRWDLNQIWPYLKYLFPSLHEDEKAQSFLAEFYQFKMRGGNPAERVDTFSKLDAWFGDVLTAAETDDGNQWAWRSHHKATLYRLRRMLIGLVARCGGVVSKNKTAAVEDIDVTGWQHGQIVVVDIAGLSSDVQGVVIARTLDRLLQQSEVGEGTGVDHIVVWADELNAFAPARGGEHAAVKKLLQRTATQGRYAGVTILGMGQSLSRVDDLIVDNASTVALGVTRESELGSGGYGRLTKGLTERIATLPKGHMVVWHHMFRSAMVIRFPRPAWQTGRAKKSAGRQPRGTAKSSLNLNDAQLRKITEGISDEQATDIIAAADDPQEAIRQLQKQRVPDVREAFLHEQAGHNPGDPFALGD